VEWDCWGGIDMKEEMKETKRLLEACMKDEIEGEYECEMRTSILGSRTAFVTNVSRQTTLDEFNDEVRNGKSSFLVLNVLINPRYFKEWSVEKMALSIYSDLLRKINAS
jgi:hypothetical protein